MTTEAIFMCLPPAAPKDNSASEIPDLSQSGVTCFRFRDRITLWE
jgi:hypothetical protein